MMSWARADSVSRGRIEVWEYEITSPDGHTWFARRAPTNTRIQRTTRGLYRRETRSAIPRKNRYPSPDERLTANPLRGAEEGPAQKGSVHILAARCVRGGRGLASARLPPQSEGPADELDPDPVRVRDERELPPALPPRRDQGRRAPPHEAAERRGDVAYPPREVVQLLPVPVRAVVRAGPRVPVQLEALRAARGLEVHVHAAVVHRAPEELAHPHHPRVEPEGAVEVADPDAGVREAVHGRVNATGRISVALRREGASLRRGFGVRGRVGTDGGLGLRDLRRRPRAGHPRLLRGGDPGRGERGGGDEARAAGVRRVPGRPGRGVRRLPRPRRAPEPPRRAPGLDPEEGALDHRARRGPRAMGGVQRERRRGSAADARGVAGLAHGGAGGRARGRADREVTPRRFRGIGEGMGATGFEPVTFTV